MQDKKIYEDLVRAINDLALKICDLERSITANKAKIMLLEKNYTDIYFKGGNPPLI